MSLRSGPALALALLVAGTVLADEPVGAWREFGQYEDIRLYMKEIPGSDVLAFRGSGVVPAPTAKLLTVVTDASRKTEWLDRTAEARVIETVSPLEKIEYTRISMPWPLTDRDFLYRIRLSPDPAGHRIVIEVESVMDPRVPEYPHRVRGQIDSGRFVLTALGEGRHLGETTGVEAETHADPRGAIPKWLVNLVQKSWPGKTLSHMMAQVAKPDIVSSQFVLALLAPQGAVHH